MTEHAQDGLRRIAVVTGASSGIGLACATQLNSLGFQVFAGVRRESDADALRERACSALQPLFLDVGDSRSLTEAAGQVAKRIDELPAASWELCLVNNAGATFTGPLEFLDLDDLRAQLEVNLIGQLGATQTFLPLMRRGKGRIVFVGSMFGRFAAPFIGPYCASKFALKGLADSLRMELGPWRIPVSVVEAGVVNTPIWNKYDAHTERLLERISDEARALYEEQISNARRTATRSGRGGMPPEKVARVIGKCLTAPKPKTNYTVGLDSRLGILGSRLLPARLLDRLTLLRMGTSTRSPRT